METTSAESQGARYFGQTSPRELRDLERNAIRAAAQHLAQAASYLEQAFDGQYYAWFGGWALRLRGSRRETRDIDLLVLAPDVRQVRATLAPYSWAILSYYELNGSLQERMFVDIGGGQVVGVDIVLSGQLNTPILGEAESFELIQPSFQTPQGDQVPVIHLTWQVEGKLNAWISRRKESDFTDLEFLFRIYGETIKEWSCHLTLEWRVQFYEVFKAGQKDKARRRRIKEILGLAGNGSGQS